MGHEPNMANKLFERKNIVAVCAGIAGLALIFISILLLVPLDGGTVEEIKTTTPATKTWADENCLVSAMKRTERALLTFCYDREKNERLTIYCDGTAVAWSKDAIRRVARFLKRTFETMEPLEQRKGYHLELIPYMKLHFENGILRYAVLEQKCNVSAYAVYTLYHWLCF